MDRAFFLRNLWRWSVGLPELPAPSTNRFTYQEAADCWFPGFIQLMHNRMIQGAFRYGDFRDPNQLNYDRLAAMFRHIHAYEQTGNTEHLVDAANLLAIEFEVGAHPLKHFAAVDDDPDMHVTVKE